MTVDGLVRRHGGYVLQTGDTVASVVGQAGGSTAEAPPVYVLVRTRAQQQVSCLAKPSDPLESGDNLIFAVKESKMPMPAQSCDVAIAALSKAR